MFLDVIVAVWCALWLLLGYVIHQEVLGLRKLSNTVVIAGQALDSTADQLETLSDVPFVGDRVKRTAAEARRTARSARFSGRESRRSVTHLARWLWFAVSAIAVLPILLVYGLLRFPNRRLA